MFTCFMSLLIYQIMHTELLMADMRNIAKLEARAARGEAKLDANGKAVWVIGGICRGLSITTVLGLMLWSRLLQNFSREFFLQRLLY